ncbi:hypothetical protein D3C78_729610 [compost metagenome]
MFFSVTTGAVCDRGRPWAAADLGHVVSAAIAANGLALAVDGQAATLHSSAHRPAAFRAVGLMYGDLALTVLELVLQT